MIVGVADAIHGNEKTAESDRNLLFACTCSILIALTYTLPHTPWLSHMIAIWRSQPSQSSTRYFESEE